MRDVKNPVEPKDVVKNWMRNRTTIEGTVITSGTPTVGQVLATGGTGGSGRNGANIGYGGGLTGAGAELTAGTAGNGTNYGTI